MNAVVLYRSKSGFTRKYAEWIAADLRAGLFDCRKIIDNTFFLIGRIRERYKAFLEGELRKRGMTGFVTSHADILVALTMCGELTLSEVAQKIHRDRSTVTTLVAKLENLGYILQRKGEEWTAFRQMLEKVYTNFKEA